VPDGSVEAVHVGNDQLAFTQHIHDETLGAWVE
jgi:hypothetical protein